MNALPSALKHGVLNVTRAVLNRVQSSDGRLIAEDPGEAARFIHDNPEMRELLEDAPTSFLSAQWDMDSSIVENVRILKATYATLECGDSSALTHVEIAFECTLRGDEEEALAEVSSGIVPTLTHAETTFTFSFFEEYECEFTD